MDTSALVAWLVDGARGATTSSQVLTRVNDDLVKAGVPVARSEAFVRTLHPHFVGRSFVWRPGEAVKVRENSYAFLQSAEFTSSPVSEVFSTGAFQRRRAGTPGTAKEQSFLTRLAERGFSDFFAAPLTFLSGEHHALTFATKTPGGFTDEHLAALRSVVAPLTRVAEILALTRTAANLLSVYVGHNAGERILSGKIQRGDVDSIRAVIWFSDLRGFTSMASEIEPGELIAVLNDFFDCQVPAIDRHGGEVLKFMGDGLLGIFPIAAGDTNAGAMCDGALDAAAMAFSDLGKLNDRRSAAGRTALQFGLALHVGNLTYGNIGGAGRLDFTCIGPAVNIASRLEGVASKLGEEVVVSDDFKVRSSRAMRSLGEFPLKGVPLPQAVWAPAGVGSAR